MTEEPIKPVENVVYILGAGFSAPLGIPVMSNFLEKSKDMFSSDPDRWSRFKKVFQTIDRMYKSKGYFNANLFNIEEILSILEMNEELGGETERSLFSNYILDVVQYYTPKMNNKPELGSWRQQAFGYNLLNSYGYFVGCLLGLSVSVNNQADFFCNRIGEADILARYSVVTLNYDAVLENCFSYLVENFHASNVFGFSRVLESDDAQFSQRTHLAKLHGSVDTRVIVPPTWNKGLHENIKPDWRLAYKLLANANHIRIIGYSLPSADAYVKYLLKAAIINCEHLKSIDVMCLDFDGTVEKRYNEFICFPNYTFRNGHVEDYLLNTYNACINDGGVSPVLWMNGLEAGHKMSFGK